ncbi:hypothetical protein DW921_03955 [Phocaeicola coprophilus]|uniref:Uncharacterized protein n=1 Tax=Phocaeicola coprophilus TaxID=387090 RepID=A0A413T2K7_9BACT|nr:hypothetical protein DW921_03955 [Phocaeicola coprophilus]
MLQALFALFRFPFSLSVHLIYLRLLTVLPAILILQPAYQTVSDDFFLYYISFVYLKSIKDLSSFRLPFLSESGCKGKCFFLFCQTFQKFFSKKFFFQGNRKDDFLAPLDNTKVRYSHSPERIRNRIFQHVVSVT